MRRGRGKGREKKEEGKKNAKTTPLTSSLHVKGNNMSTLSLYTERL